MKIFLFLWVGENKKKPFNSQVKRFLLLDFLERELLIS